MRKQEAAKEATMNRTAQRYLKSSKVRDNLAAAAAAKEAESFAELMGKFNEYQAKWVEANGTKAGFETWFTAQIFNAEGQAR